MAENDLLNLPDAIFTGFRLATMCDCETLTALSDASPDGPYGELAGFDVAVRDGRILSLTPTRDPEPEPKGNESTVRIDGGGLLLTPGLIDCHTHLVFGGNRADEWEARLKGKSYEEIAREGGGILSTVRATRAANEFELFQSAMERLRCLMNEGVTTVEIKSGYGLDTESELKMLRVARRLGEELPVDVKTTLLAAHAIPQEFIGRADDYVNQIVVEMIPGSEGLADAVDVFCESIAFDVRQSMRVLNAGREHGLQVKAHAEQLSRTGIAVEAARTGAISVDHLEFLARDDCQVLAEHETVATLLPGAFYCLCETQAPPVGTLLECGVPIAIATDCNPGSSPLVSILTAGHLACTKFGLAPELVLAGMTRNAAKALGLSDRGMIAPGMRADFAAWDVNSPAEILYEIGRNRRKKSWLAGVEVRL